MREKQDIDQIADVTAEGGERIKSGSVPGFSCGGSRSCWRTISVFLLFLISFMGIYCSSTAYAGKGAYPDPINQIVDDVKNILIKHGMPVRHDRENAWFKHAASTDNYKLSFYKADEVPQEAIIEVIRYCMNHYEKNGRSEKFKILLYREVFKPQLRLFSDGNAFFRLTIGGNK